jgi:hypothetical protein
MHAALGVEVVRAHAGAHFCNILGWPTHCTSERAIVTAGSLQQRTTALQGPAAVYTRGGATASGRPVGIQLALIRPPCGAAHVPQQRPSGAGWSLSTRPSVEVEMV